MDKNLRQQILEGINISLKELLKISEISEEMETEIDIELFRAILSIRKLKIRFKEIYPEGF
jgi:hypothetical protein